MEDIFWSILYGELNSKIIITSKENIPFIVIRDSDCPVSQFESYILDIANRFIGECRRNMKELNQVPPFFEDLLYKLDFLFSHQFGTHFPEGDIPFPLNYEENTIPAINSAHDPYISAVHAKIQCFSMAITYLRQLLNYPAQPKTNHRIRKKADIRDFKITVLSTAQLSDILKMGKRLGLFSRDTNQKVFVDIFSGRPANNSINWTSTIYSLNKFINGINGKGINKLTDGKWLVVSQLFVVDGREVLEHSLLRPGIGKNDELDKVDNLISYFNSPDELGD